MKYKPIFHLVQVFYGLCMCMQLYRESFRIIISDINYSLESKQHAQFCAKHNTETPQTLNKYKKSYCVLMII